MLILLMQSVRCALQNNWNFKNSKLKKYSYLLKIELENYFKIKKGK